MLGQRAVQTTIFLLGLVSVTFADPKSASPNGLTIRWANRFLEVDGPAVPGGAIRTHYLEAYCRPGSTDRDWAETVIPHTSELREATADQKRIELEDRLTDGVVVRHEIVAGTDEVTFTVTATNRTEVASSVHWAQPCMRIDRFTGCDQRNSREVRPTYIEKCFLFTDGIMTRLPTEPWALQARYVTGQVYCPVNVPRNDVNPRPLSRIVPSCGLTGCYSADGSMILAVAWEPYQEVFQGVITCLHNDFRIAGLEPGETKTIRGKLYILPANERELIERFQRDFPAQAAGAKSPRVLN